MSQGAGGPQPPSQAKQFFGANVKFFVQKPAAKNEKNISSSVYQTKTWKSFLPARWSA